MTGRVIINGVVVGSGKNVSVVNGTVIVDGKEVGKNITQEAREINIAQSFLPRQVKRLLTGFILFPKNKKRPFCFWGIK